MRYAFEDCILDTARRELRRAGGVPGLSRKSTLYSYSFYLVQHAERM